MMQRPSNRKSPGLNAGSLIRSWHWVLAGLMCLVGSSRAQSEYDPMWTKNFRVGAMTAVGIKGKFKLNGDFNISGNSPGATGVSGVDHVYDDGYVLVDDTGNAEGFTSYWGYENASQYDAGSQQLLMHSSSSYTAIGSASENNDFAVGVDLAYGGVLRHWGRTRLGWEFGFGFLPFELQDSSPISANVNRATYAFDTGGIVMPSAPYEGGSSGIGSTIRDIATEVSSDTVPATIRGSRSIDAFLYSFRLGPTLFYDLSPYVGLAVGMGPAIGVVDQTYNYHDDITFSDGSTAKNNGSFSSTDVIYGGYVNGTATYHVEAGGDIYVGVQYMPMSSSSISKNGREGSLEFGGQVYFSLGVNWPF